MGQQARPTNSFIPFPREDLEQSVPARFAKQVRSYPERLAVKTRGYTLTYTTLNDMANGVAQALLARRGAGAEPIALLLDKEAPLIAATLGVLKAGKIYVPLDPTLPQARLETMLADVQAGLLVTNNQQSALAHVLARHAVPVLNLDAVDGQAAAEDPNLPLSPDALAYILYTSGSTGVPKGVTQTHRNVLHQCMRVTNSLHLCAHDRVTLFASLSTSQAASDMHSTLLNGAALHSLDLKEEGVAHLAQWLIRHEMTIYRSSASVFRTFIDSLTGQERFPKLRVIKLGGEPVTSQDVALYKKHFAPDCLFLNALSSTEALTFRQYCIDKHTLISGNIVPVGYAVEDVEVILLDESGAEVGSNCMGEIAVKSRYLSPGYWRNPELTRAAFFPDPAGSEARIYRTGDLGLLRPDTCLEHLGRKDYQVKIRGYRIEVAEVEMALCDHEAIAQAVVVPRADDRCERRLVAYFVPLHDPGPAVGALQRFLQARLPDYMVPSAFIKLRTFPLTPSGKLDLRALPPPAWERPPLAQPLVAPRTPVEEQLAQIWAEVLGIGRIGVFDPFLELGGHSLLATQILSRIIRAWHIDIPLQTLLEAPTVAQMAVIITQHQAAQAGEEALHRLLTDIEPLPEDVE